MRADADGLGLVLGAGDESHTIVYNVLVAITKAASLVVIVITMWGITAAARLLPPVRV